MRTIVVLGAAGRVGEAAAREFVAAGWRVKGLARNAKAASLAPGVEVVQGDATDRAALIEACKGADVILNALNPLYTEWAEKVLPMAENVIAAAEASGATHMLPGNVYNFGYGLGVGTAETAPEVPSTEKAEIRIGMEDLFRRKAQERGVQTIVLRAGDFYGGARPESWLDLIILSKLRKNVFTWGGPMDIPHAFAYLPDLGKAFVALAEKRESLGPFERFHFAGHTLTGHQMKAAAEAASGRKLASKRVPWIALRAAALFSPLMREVVKMSYLWRTPHSLNGDRLERTVGKLPATDPVDAIRQAIADLNLDDSHPTAVA
ncbi:NAD-dependent epimerase/dehydratase family protein [Mesorhizobium sp. WSM4310]|uniref:NmrA family NAD(P)-binding protein n=1 Tax=Mesorhizobium sp. WSM4310 TaxID=2589883 RepID=UPI00115D7DD8|nr:NmrA family NAD(P)-binding protein [Mesorhizobium sp. WSM4310]TRC85073.1 NAD-dependent epimerase/dehydratase family protein [Mesorhizobium sp. WSM4310]